MHIGVIALYDTKEAKEARAPTEVEIALQSANVTLSLLLQQQNEPNEGEKKRVFVKFSREQKKLRDFVKYIYI